MSEPRTATIDDLGLERRRVPYAVFQLAEAALPRAVFAGVLGLITGLRGLPAVAASA